MAQVRAQPDHGKSWMLPEAKGEDLLYVSNEEHNLGYGDVLVFSYATGKLVGTLNGFSSYVWGLCSDHSGDIFVTAASYVSPASGYVYKFSHAGTQAVEALSDPGAPNSCSVDPTTGNLAVANTTGPLRSGYYYGDVALYRYGSNSPTTYFDSDIPSPLYCSYDDAGDLFIDGLDGPGNMVGELISGSASFANITLNHSIGPISLQWDRDSLVMSGGGGNVSHGEQKIFQAYVSGSGGRVTGPVLLWSRGDRKTGEAAQFLSRGGIILGPDHTTGGNDGIINFWRFPGGGKPTKTLRQKGADSFYGVAVSAISN